MAPRGAAKSRWSTFAYPAWCLLEGLEPYVAVVSDTARQSEQFLAELRRFIESPQALAAYPHAAGRGPEWKSDALTLRNGTRCAAYSTGGTIRGAGHDGNRPTLIVVDDPQNKDHIVSPLQRQRSWDWFTKDLLNAVEPSTNVLVLGTNLHRESIVGRLPDTPGWRTSTFRAVTQWPPRMDLWREWEGILTDPRLSDGDRDAQALAFYLQHQADMDAGAEVLWPEREPLYALMRHRAVVGPAAFNSEKQNDPNDPTLAEWPPEYFDHAAFWFDIWPEKLAVKTLALDPSKGADSGHGDYSAIVLFGRDAQENEYVEADLQRRDPARIVVDFVTAVERFRPEMCAVESNTFQSLFAPLIRAEAEARRVEMPPIRLIDNTVPKHVRIRRLTTPLAKRRMRFKARSPGTAILVQQLRDFPNGAHDDGPDCGEVARRVAIEVVNGRARK